MAPGSFVDVTFLTTQPSTRSDFGPQDDCPGIDVQCPRKDDGCTVVLQRRDLAAHLAVCPYERLRSEVNAMRDKVKECREQVRALETGSKALP